MIYSEKFTLDVLASVGKKGIMKTLFRTQKRVALVAGIVCSVLILSCAQQQVTSKTGGKVEISKDMIVIHPGTKISKGDEQALNDVLKKYDKRLYRIETYKEGKLVKTRGRLADAYISRALKAEIDKTKMHGADGDEVQATCPPPCPIPTPAPAAEKKKLIQELTPILEKY